MWLACVWEGSWGLCGVDSTWKQQQLGAEEDLDEVIKSMPTV